MKLYEGNGSLHINETIAVNVRYSIQVTQGFNTTRSRTVDRFRFPRKQYTIGYVRFTYAQSETLSDATGEVVQLRMENNLKCNVEISRFSHADTYATIRISGPIE